MAQKTTAPTRTAAKKAIVPAKKPAARTASKRSYGKGDHLVCDTCGLSVIVDEYGDVVGMQEVICCGEAMEVRPRSAKKSTRSAKPSRASKPAKAAKK